MTDREFFLRAVLAIIPPIAEKNNEKDAAAKAIVIARHLTGQLQQMGGIFEGQPTMTSVGPIAANLVPVSPATAQHNGGMVSQQPIQAPVMVPTVVT